MEKLGNYSFIAGVIIAIVLGLATAQLGTAAAWLWSLLVVLGLIVGFMNVSGKGTRDFLWVTVALVLVSYAGKDQIANWANVHFVGAYLSGVLGNILAFVIPASVVVALKEVWVLAKG